MDMDKVVIFKIGMLVLLILVSVMIGLDLFEDMKLHKKR